ncbi:MAG: 2-phospho-L-lactate guanylyltransferase [Anaerolineaceae bacterium]|nr:2-phospho-L-lactate guanylyltransferase [Anaerolineaceae bacterium]
MITWAIIPTKPFQEGKSRLSGIMNDTERYQFNEFCFIRTLSVLRAVDIIDKILVVSRDKHVLEAAAQMGAYGILEAGKSGLNRALRQATNTLDKNQDRAIIIPTDLPLMSEKDISEILELGSNPPVIVIVPDRHENGTNVLLVNPAGCIHYQFGTRSSRKHIEGAEKMGIKVVVKKSGNLRLDIDELGDIEYLKTKGFIIPMQAVNSYEETKL